MSCRHKFIFENPFHPQPRSLRKLSNCNTRPAQIDVQALRTRIGLTQEEFAAKFGISLGTLRHWQRGARRPHGPALVLLRVIDRNERAVLRALA